MLVETPQWTFCSPKPLTQWYGHVVLLPHHVLGQWFCLERETGDLKWQRHFYRPNRFCDMDCGVIVADEMRSDGPWTANFGCYGISLETGEMLWTSHGSGIWGYVWRLLDYLPMFTNDLRDTPSYVQEGQVFCYSGRVLEINTGKTLKRISRKTVENYERPKSLTAELISTSMNHEQKKVPIGNNISLYHPAPLPGHDREDWKIIAENEQGQEVWRISAEQLNHYHTGTNFYSYRIAVPYLYLVVSEEPEYVPHPTQKHWVEPNPTLWHLMTFDLWSGRLVQTLPLGNEKLTKCRIEDLDEDYLLIGNSNHQLFMFQRVHGSESASQLMNPLRMHIFRSGHLKFL